MKHEGRIALIVRARQANLTIHEVDDSYLPLMDKASSGRPHNGFILEASPLPRPPITSLTTSSIESGYFTAPLDTQTREDLAINGTKTQHSYSSSGWRHPFLLYIDGVLDEGNLGNIIRSAYFLGVDGVVTSTRNCAPMSHVTLKASAGAAEAIPLFTVAEPASFLASSALAGWRIYASDAIPRPTVPISAVAPASSPSIADNSSNITFSYAKSTRFLEAHSPLQQHPTILMMGGEGTGLRSSLVNHAHYKVGIRAARNVDEVGVDSLNVAVAAGMLCFEILKKPGSVRKAGDLLF
jgi:21S rRNA (GM2251-2'-O)-methyltransferase